MSLLVRPDWVRRSLIRSVGSARAVVVCRWRRSGRPGRPTAGRPRRRGVLGIVFESHPALRAQARAVVPAQRLERQRQHHGVPQRRLEVDQVTVQARRPPRRLASLLRDRRTAPGGRPRAGRRSRSGSARTPRAAGRRGAGDQHALDHRLQPKVQLERGALGTPMTSIPRSAGAGTMVRTSASHPGDAPARGCRAPRPSGGPAGDGATFIAVPFRPGGWHVAVTGVLPYWSVTVTANSAGRGSRRYSA